MKIEKRKHLVKKWEKIGKMGRSGKWEKLEENVLEKEKMRENLKQ